MKVKRIGLIVVFLISCIGTIIVGSLNYIMKAHKLEIEVISGNLSELDDNTFEFFSSNKTDISSLKISRDKFENNIENLKEIDLNGYNQQNYLSEKFITDNSELLSDIAKDTNKIKLSSKDYYVDYKNKLAVKYLDNKVDNSIDFKFKYYDNDKAIKTLNLNISKEKFKRKNSILTQTNIESAIKNGDTLRILIENFFNEEGYITMDYLKVNLTERTYELINIINPLEESSDYNEFLSGVISNNAIYLGNSVDGGIQILKYDIESLDNPSILFDEASIENTEEFIPRIFKDESNNIYYYYREFLDKRYTKGIIDLYVIDPSLNQINTFKNIKYLDDDEINLDSRITRVLTFDEKAYIFYSNSNEMFSSESQYLKVIDLNTNKILLELKVNTQACIGILVGDDNE